MSNLKRGIGRVISKQTGLKVDDFCRVYLGSDYRAFQARLRRNVLYPSEVMLICWKLNMTCEDIFGKSFQELVLYQGKHPVPDAVREIYDNAEEEERQRLLQLLIGRREAVAKQVAHTLTNNKKNDDVRKYPLTKKEAIPTPKSSDDVFDFVQDFYKK